MIEKCVNCGSEKLIYLIVNHQLHYDPSLFHPCYKRFFQICLDCRTLCTYYEDYNSKDLCRLTKEEFNGLVKKWDKKSIREKENLKRQFRNLPCAVLIR